jgi:hypothetical protein
LPERPSHWRAIEPLPSSEFTRRPPPQPAQPPSRAAAGDPMVLQPQLWSGQGIY